MTPTHPSPLSLTLGAVVGVGAALLVACGSSSSQLIPAGNAGPLQSDFNAVESSVRSGDCAAAKKDVQQTQQDLAGLPGTVSPRLLETLTTGVHTLAARAGTECKQNTATGTTTTGQTSTPASTQTTTSTNTTPTNTHYQPTDTNTQPTNTNTNPNTTPANTNTTPATTVPDSTGGPPAGSGGAQAPGQSAGRSSDPSGGTPGGGN